MSAGASAAVAPAPEILLLSETESAPLRKFYLEEMRPFLEQPRMRGRDWRMPRGLRACLRDCERCCRRRLMEHLRDLEDICDEARQLLRQERLHRWLHGWLLLHIPLSLALILLGAVHAVMALAVVKDELTVDS